MAKDIGPIQSAPGQDIGPIQSAGTTGVNETFSDTLSVSDSILVGIGLIFSDQITFVDSLDQTLPVQDLLINDDSWVNVLSDTQEYELGLLLDIADSISFGDMLEIGLGIDFEGDQFNFTDSIISESGIPLEITGDQLSFSDATDNTIYGILFTQLSDTFSFSDEIDINLRARFDIDVKNESNAADIFLVTDTIKLLMVSNLDLNDSISFTDEVEVALLGPMEITLSITDIINLSDELSTQRYDGVYLNFADSLNLLDHSIALVFNTEIQLHFNDVLEISDGLATSQGQSIIRYIRRYLNDI